MASYRLLVILVFSSALVSARRSAADSYPADCPYPCLLPPPTPVTNCPPPPSTPSIYSYPPPSSSSTNTPSSYWSYPPPPPQPQGGYIPYYQYQPPADGGFNYPAPPPPNPIVPWYPWYNRPPPSSATAVSALGRPVLAAVVTVAALITVF